jgi:hypothetical protein
MRKDLAAVTKRDNSTTTRRTVLAAGLAAIGGVASLRAEAQEKIAQNLVQYQATPKDGAQCNKCVNWVEPNACKIVSGTIAPSGWCVAYAPKEG